MRFRLLLRRLAPALFWALPASATAGILALDEFPEWSAPAPPDISARRSEARAVPLPEPGTFELAVTPAHRLARLRNRYLDVAAAGPFYGGDRERIPALHLSRGVADLRDLAARTPGEPPLLRCRKRRCELRAPLFVGADATLLIVDLALGLDADRGAMLVVAGSLFLERAELLGRKDGRPAVFRDAGRFRPFLLVLSGGRGILRDSRLAHLGFAGGRAYGLTFAADRPASEAPPPTGLVLRSEIVGLYYGFYTHAARGIDLLDNIFRGNIRYGIDPHDDSHGLLIAGNRVEGTRERHGIVLSRRVTGSAVIGNRVSGNGGSGIMLDRRSDRNLVADNLVTGNGADGISVYESDGVWLLRNILRDNGRTGIRVRNSRGVILAGNRALANRDAGVRLYTGPAPRTAAELGAAFAERLSCVLEDNFLDGNQRADIVVKGGVEWLAFRREGPVGRPPVIEGDRIWRRALAAVATGRPALLVDSRLVPSPALIRPPRP